MIIRKANSGDLKSLEKINIVAKKEQGWWIPQKANFYKNFLKNKNNEIYLALNSDNLIGFLSLEHNKERKSTWINDVYVLPKERKKGVAKKLVKTVTSKWKNKSKSIVLLTADRNLPVFEKIGFKKSMNFMELSRK